MDQSSQPVRQSLKRVKKRRRGKKPHIHRGIYGLHFNYDYPNEWYLENPTCSGEKQSPIALSSKKLETGSIDPISFGYYDLPFAEPLKIKNIGHTVSIDITPTINGYLPTITDGGLTEIYEVINIHFHWGCKSRKGSEHAVDGKKFDLEMHIVHKNKRFSMKDASEDPTGLVVFGILFNKTMDKQSILDSDTLGLSAIYDALPSLSISQTEKVLDESITMKSFLGDLNIDQFFKYKGSRTSPPCGEVVTWYIFPDIQQIAVENLERFFKLEDDRGLPILNNFRPLQSSFLRRVYLRNGKQTHSGTELLPQ